MLFDFYISAASCEIQDGDTLKNGFEYWFAFIHFVQVSFYYPQSSVSIWIKSYSDFFKISMKNHVEILMEIALNLWIAFRIFTIFILFIQEQKPRGQEVVLQ